MDKELRFEKFKERAVEIHNGFYNYSQSKYISAHIKVDIICPVHGLFQQSPSNHLSKHGCKECGLEKGGNYKYDTETFIEKANTVHNFRYQYPRTSYVNIHKNVYITCSVHGEFEQTCSMHIQGQGCPKCVHKISKPEIEIQNLLSEMGYKTTTNKKSIIKPYELDIYIPSLKKAIEFNGKYWHYSKKHFKAGKHAMKSNLCREKGIVLLHVREDLWIRDKEKMKNIIIKFLEI